MIRWASLTGSPTRLGTITVFGLLVTGIGVARGGARTGVAVGVARETVGVGEASGAVAWIEPNAAAVPGSGAKPPTRETPTTLMGADRSIGTETAKRLASR